MTQVGLFMLLAPICYCLWQLYGPLFKAFDRKAWLIFAAVTAWEGAAMALVIIS